MPQFICPHCSNIFWAENSTICPMCEKSLDEPPSTLPSPVSNNLGREVPAPEVSQGITNRHANRAFAERTSDQKKLIEDLKQVYQDFAKPVGRSSTTFGCLTALVIIAGIITCFNVSWLLGIIGSIAVLAVMVYISDRVESPHKERARERVSQLEELYALSHQESFDLLFATRSGAKDGDKHEWKAFVTEVWGAYLASKQKQEPIPKSTAGSTICPLCKSASIARKSEFKSNTAGHLVGQALFGIFGNIILGAATGRTIENCECEICGHKWVNEKPRG